jgi:hypothetical protein
MDELELAVRMRRMLYGQLLSRTLCAVAVLDIPDLLADRPLSVAELAAKSGSDPDALGQVLRSLVPFGVFVEHEDDTFGLTPLGATLRSDAVASAMPTALLVHGEVGQAWGELLWTLQTGETAYGKLFGTDFFTHLDGNPTLREVFHKSQEHGLRLDIEGILRHIDFTGCSVLVDVGGGDGALLECVLGRYPELRGVLIDLPAVVAEAGVRFAAAGLGDRAELCGGDFFGSVPAGGDVYLLRQITHDLDDDRCVALLRSCRRAMKDGATLLIMDLMRDAHEVGDAASEMTALMDLYMISIFGGRERSRAELGRLLERAGLRMESVTRVSGQMAAVRAIPVPV